MRRTVNAYYEGSTPSVPANFMSETNKICVKHGQTKFLLCKSKNASRFRCGKCLSDAVQKRRDRIKELAVESKGGKCERCGYNKCIKALQFHHLDPKEKDFGISRKGHTRSWAKVKVEIDKCILVCANCHAEIHYENS